jgi:hypothetical protein
VLRQIMSTGNATVLTSSRGTQLSREDDAWQNGAFAKVFVEALSDPRADTNRDGLISMTELLDYLSRSLSRLPTEPKSSASHQAFKDRYSLRV